MSAVRVRAGQSLLDLELRLLVARYGRRAVSASLSRIGEVDPTTLESSVAAFEADAKRPRESTRRQSLKSADEVIGSLNLAVPEVHALLQKLGHAYEAKTFLPALREVRRFLETRGITAARLRSRADALTTVLTTLSRLPMEELFSIDAERLDKRSDLGIISDQILRPVRDTPQTKPNVVPREATLRSRSAVHPPAEATTPLGNSPEVSVSTTSSKDTKHP